MFYLFLRYTNFTASLCYPIATCPCVVRDLNHTLCVLPDVIQVHFVASAHTTSLQQAENIAKRYDSLEMWEFNNLRLISRM